jgi:hypothetical protein
VANWRGLAVALGSLLAIAVGAGAGLAAIPSIFVRVPHDLRRTAVLLSALRAGEPTPSVAVFGNSIAMCGIDGGALQASLGSGATAMNLSSTGQTLAESLLYYQELPAATRTLVYAVPPMAFESGIAFNAHVYNAFVLSGYALDSWTRGALEDAFPPADLGALGEPAIAQRFEGRWVIREWIDGGLRRLVRRDLDLERAYTDLRFPAPYTRKVPADALESELARLIAGRKPGPLVPAESQVQLVRSLLEKARADGRRVVVALAPVHPRLLAAWGPEYLAPVRELAAQLGGAGADVIDSTELLDAGSFIDSVHPTPEAASRWTAAVAAAIAAPTALGAAR